MATMKKAAPKAQKGKSVMKAYVDKYKNEGGISNMDVARDTLGGSSPRNNQYSGGFGGGRMNQIKDLQAAHDKKFGKKSTIDERKNGGPVKKAQSGASMEDPFARKLPKKVGVLPSMTRVKKDSTTTSIKKGPLQGFKKGPSVSKMKYKTGGVVKKAQVGKTIKKISDTKLKDVPAKAMNLGRKVINRVKNSTVGDAVNVATMGAGTAAANMYKAATKKSSAKKPSLNTIVPGGGRNFYDIDMSKKDRISPEMSRKGTSIKKAQMGGFVSNGFAAKSIAKSKSKSKIVDSKIKPKKDIYAFEGKKGMLAKSGTKLKKK